MKHKKPLVVNLIAGPGAGKSTTMAAVFAGLKWGGINCEMAAEYAKEKVWEESFRTLDNQIYVFGKHHKLHRLASQVDCIVTDSPLFMSLVYGTGCSDTFRKLVLEEFEKYYNLNFFLTRTKRYNPKGRLQTEEQAKELDAAMLSVLNQHQQISYSTVPGNQYGAEHIVNTVLALLQD